MEYKEYGGALESMYYATVSGLGNLQDRPLKPTRVAMNMNIGIKQLHHSLAEIAEIAI